ncbi:hypothetical protein UFOVP242_109 [uncultured Caudovirales phage]|uniref:Uncharacterized protein n=1 Tax=uncultured Caudovirales phage TaxID=2100421 RepID=A0A6J7WVU7_9CAUD|nr:hypothetical protein UFOVP242_109 [uncultured Caudovirales phage]
MQTPSASDSSFKAFLDKLQEQNNRGFLTQLVQLKTEREIAGEDDDKREEQLDEAIAALKDVRVAITGISLDIDITPLVNIGENQTRLLEELSRESALTRKLTEGSVEYDKEASQYRNKSGREIESVVSGKMSKKGGFIDFETARNATSGQGERARTANEVKLKTIDYVPGKVTASAVTNVTNNNTTNDNTDNSTTEEKSFFKYLGDEIGSGIKYFMTDGLSEGKNKKDRTAKVSSARQKPESANPKAEGMAIAQQEVASNTKSDLEISKQLLDTTKAQLTELQAIKEALAPSTPKELVEQKSAPSATEKEDTGGGSILGDLAGAAGDLLGGRRGRAKKAGKGIGGKMLGGIGKAARVLGPVAAIAGAAYSGVEGLQNTNANFDLEDGQEATVGQKTASALGGVASGLTFGLLDEKTAAQGIHKAGEVIGDTASKAGNYLSEKASSIGSSVGSFFGIGKDTSKQIPVQGVSTGEAAAARSSYAAVDPRRVDSAGRTVAGTSTENADMARESVGGGGGSNTIVSNNVNSTNTTKYVPMKASPRPEFSGSALDRYQNRIAVY